jgi:hypothetical protein
VAVPWPGAAGGGPAGGGGGGGGDAAAAEARIRLKHQIPDVEKAAQADYVLENAGSLDALADQVRALWGRLKEENDAESNNSRRSLSLE